MAARCSRPHLLTKGIRPQLLMRSFSSAELGAFGGLRRAHIPQWTKKNPRAYPLTRSAPITHTGTGYRGG
jgi:hypothetical protein